MAEYECVEDFYPNILMEISDVDTRTIKMMFGEAQTKFCRDSRALVQVTETVIEEGKLVYPCIPQYDGYNQTVDTVVAGKTENSLNPLEFQDRWTIADDRNSITLNENYITGTTAGYIMQIISTVIPYKNADSIDENIYELYGYIIVTLTKHLIYNQRNKPWSDKAEAKDLLFEYNEMLNTVQFDNIAGGNTSGNQSINLEF